MVVILATIFAHAQNHSDSYFRSNPVWIQMMNDTNVNYYQAIRAFDLYWEHRDTPGTEHELFTLSETEKSKGIYREHRNQKSEEAKKYAFEYKKFKKWALRNEAFVKENGQLMTPAERITQWNHQMQNRK